MKDKQTWLLWMSKVRDNGWHFAERQGMVTPVQAVLDILKYGVRPPEPKQIHEFALSHDRRLVLHRLGAPVTDSNLSFQPQRRERGLADSRC